MREEERGTETQRHRDTESKETHTHLVVEVPLREVNSLRACAEVGTSHNGAHVKLSTAGRVCECVWVSEGVRHTLRANIDA